MAEPEVMTRLAESLAARGFVVEEGTFAIGRPDRPTLAVRTPDGRAAIAKAYAPGGATAAYDNLRRVWLSSFGQRRAPHAVPEPLECLADIDVVLTERMPGQPLASTIPGRLAKTQPPRINTPVQRGVGDARKFETVSTVSTRVGKPLKRFSRGSVHPTPLNRGVNESGHGISWAGAFTDLDLQLFDNSIRLIAELHASDAQPAKRRTSRGILRSLGRKLALVASEAPQHVEAMRSVIQALEAARASDRELVPSHGDCSPRNVLVAEGRLVLIDWDRLQLADPARDVAYFGIWNWKQDLKQGRAPRRDLLERAVEVYETSRPQAHLRRRLPFHVAAGLVRQAASLVQLWPEDMALVPGLLELARKELR